MLVWWEFGQDDDFGASPFFKETVQVYSLAKAALILELLSKLGSPCSIPLAP
jgi:hypothetical protein